MSFENLPKEIRERIERQSRREEIWCPFCKTALGQDGFDGFVSYHGDSGAKSTTCGHCNIDFWVKEHVERTFTSYRSNPDTENEGYEGEQ